MSCHTASVQVPPPARSLCHASVPVLEVVADDTPAVQAVLKADTRRLKLLEEERQLQVRLEKGEDSVAERLEKVSGGEPLFAWNTTYALLLLLMK